MIRDISEIRAALGLTTGGIADLLGVDVRTVQRYFTGERDVPEPTWRLLNLAVESADVRASLDRIVEAG